MRITRKPKADADLSRRERQIMDVLFARGRATGRCFVAASYCRNGKCRRCGKPFGGDPGCAERTDFRVFLLSARPQASKFRVRLYRAEFSHRLDQRETSQISSTAPRPQRHETSSVMGNVSAPVGLSNEHFAWAGVPRPADA